MLRLYHGRTSVCSVKARLALAEKGVDWESQLLTLRGDQFDPAYLKLNPNAVVPTIVHNGTVIIESTVIMHYVNDQFRNPPLMPAEPAARANVHMTNKLMDEHIHNACTVLTFATVNRQRLLQMTPEDLEADLARTPSRSRAEAKRQVAAHGLDAALVVHALHHLDALLDRIDAAMGDGPYIAGPAYSLADIAATPYVWRLSNLKLARMWDKRPGVAAWFDRIRERPSFAIAIDGWLTQADLDRYSGFQPDPWSKVSEILQRGSNCAIRSGASASDLGDALASPQAQPNSLR
jgi:glutathione S-transferase